MSVDRVQEETTSTQFIQWAEFLDRDVNAFHREDYFLAHLIAEVRRSYVKNPKSVKEETFMLKFEDEKDVEKKKEEALQDKAEKSKKSWLGWLKGTKGK